MLKAGEEFGKLTVLPTPPIPEGEKCRHLKYECQCSCGSPPKWIRESSLTNGHTIACGCRRTKPERPKETMTLPLLPPPSPSLPLPEQFYIGDLVRFETTPGKYAEGTVIRKISKYVETGSRVKPEPTIFIIDCTTGRVAFRFAEDLTMLKPWFKRKDYKAPAKVGT